MRDVLLVIDVLNDFEHEDGERLLGSFRKRIAGLELALERARASGAPVVFVNDRFGSWSADRMSVVRRALLGRGADVVKRILPRDEEPLLLKGRYSGFDHTELELLLGELLAERAILMGASTEGCVVQTGINARELGFRVTILTSACATVDEEREHVAIRYATEVAGILTSGDPVEIFGSSAERSRPARG